MQPNNLISNIQHLMQKHAIAPMDLADKLSLSALAIVKLKNGEIANPGVNTVISLAKYFEISIDKLVFDKLS